VLEWHVRSLQHQLGLQGRHLLERPLQQRRRVAIVLAAGEARDMMRRMRRAVLVAIAACSASPPRTPAPGPAPTVNATAPRADAAIDATAVVEDIEVTRERAAAHMRLAEADSQRAEAEAALARQRAEADSHLAAADSAPGPRRRLATAVLLISPANPLVPMGQGDQMPPRRFQALICAVRGKLETGLACAKLMPARTTIRTPNGPLEVVRSKKQFVDPSRDDDRELWPVPTAPECCHYNGCIGQTIPYTAAANAKVADYPATIFGVWPADADIDLEVAGAGNNGVDTSDLPPTNPPQRVRQAFARGARRFVTVEHGFLGPAMWNTGAGWIKQPSGGVSAGWLASGETLLATADVDGDGHLEIVGYQEWVNNYGLDVFLESSADPIYGYSCATI
jgi:hypothetical protein